MFMTCRARAPLSQLAGWGAARHHRGAGHESRINPNNLRQVRGSIFLFAYCVVCWWHEVWAPFQERRTTLSLRSLGREICFAVTRRYFLRTRSEKPFPSRPSFLRRRTSTGFASRRFSRWQSENQKDSRLGRVRIIISDGTCALLNAEQIKMVSREACVCAMCSRTSQGLHVCMRAYLRNLLGSAARCWPNPCCSTFICSIFCSLFVNLLCRKHEIEPLGFTCNWLVLVGGLARTSASCTYFRVADKFTTAKRKAGTLYQILQDTQLSFGCCVGLAQLREAPAHRTAASLWLRSNSRRCTGEPTPHLHARPAMFIEVTSATLRSHPKQALSTARQQGRGVLEPLYTTTSASSSWSRPRNICSACLSRWHLPRRSPPFIRLGPQPTQKCWQQWPTDELTPSRKCLLPPAWWRQTTTELAFDSRMLKLKLKSRRGRAGRSGGACVSTVDCARSHDGESTFKRNRPSFAVVSRQQCERQKCERHQCEARSANANSANETTVRMRQKCEGQVCEGQECECDFSANGQNSEVIKIVRSRSLCLPSGWSLFFFIKKKLSLSLSLSLFLSG